MAEMNHKRVLVGGMKAEKIPGIETISVKIIIEEKISRMIEEEENPMELEEEEVAVVTQIEIQDVTMNIINVEGAINNITEMDREVEMNPSEDPKVCNLFRNFNFCR